MAHMRLNLCYYKYLLLLLLFLLFLLFLSLQLPP